MRWQNRPHYGIPNAVPIVCQRMHRVFWVPKRYKAVVAVGMQGPFTIRSLAARTGYSQTGAYHAIQSLAEMAIATTRSVRGRKGHSVMVVSSDATANVPPTVRGDIDSKENLSTGNVDGTFREGSPPWESHDGPSSTPSYA